MTDVPCLTCEGLGRWIERDASGDEVETVIHECNDCAGTGISADEDYIDDFDIDEGEDED